MQFSIENVSELERRTILEIPIEDIDREVQMELKQFASKTKLRGFRPGKVPIAVAKKIQGVKIREDVLGRLINRAFESLISHLDLQIAGILSVEPNHEKESVDRLAFNTIFEIYPEVKLPDLSTILVARYTTSVSNEEIARILKNLQKQNAIFRPVKDQVARDGHRIHLIFTSSVHNTPFHQYKNKSLSFLLGEDFLHPELETAVRGMELGEEKSFSIDDKEDSEIKKSSDISIKIVGIDSVHFRNLDEIFSADKDSLHKDTDNLNEKIQESIKRQIRIWVSSYNRKSVMGSLINSIKFIVPKVLIRKQVYMAISQKQKDYSNLSIKKQELVSEPFISDELLLKAENRVRLGLIISELIKVNQITVKHDEIRTRIKEHAKDYEKPDQFVSYCLSDPKCCSEIESVLLEEKMVDYVFSVAQVEDKHIPFEKLLKGM